MLIAPQVDLPDAALTQHVAILGKTGSGKTYTAKGIVEQLLKIGRRVVIIDPTGAWWGLRLNPDGDGPGFPVIILGGQHGDAPLPAASGHACAELVTKHALQVVFDTSSMTVGDRTRWFTDFATELFRLNRAPVHVVIDEAHMFAPQGAGAMDPQKGKMLHAANTLASGGRSRGCRLMLITQRPAKLHKDSLTCCDTLIAMKVIAPQDRKAIENWVVGCGDIAKGKAVLASLAQLARGEGWVWYPEGGMLERVKFPAITTYDSSATPEDGAEIAAPQTLSSIDLTAVTATLAAAVEEAKANDVGDLKKRIKDLEAKLATARDIKPQVAQPADIENQIRHAQLDLLKGLSGRVSPPLTAIIKHAESFKLIGEAIDSLVSDVCVHIGQCPVRGDKRDTPVPQAGSSPAVESYAEPPVRAENGSNFGNGAVGSVRARGRGALTTRAAAENGSARGRGTTTSPPPGVNGTQLRILQAIASWEVMGFKPSRAMVALLAEIDPNGGHFSNSIGPLGTGGLVDQEADGITLTRAGEATAGGATPVCMSDYHAAILRVVQKKNRRSADLLACIIQRNGRKISCEDLGKQTAIDPGGGHFSNLIGPLSTLGLITRRDGIVTPTALLFPEGLS